MTKKADFNAEDWSTVTTGPLLAGMRVAMAARGGTIRESMAIAQTYARARQQHGDSELLDEIVAAPPAMDPNSVREAGDIKEAATTRLRDALAILEAKAPQEDLDAYKSFVLTVAQAAAEAHREGGVIGIGGKQVSEGEQAAIDEIAGTLNVSAAP